MLWLSKERSNCHFNCATFHLRWVRSLHCPSKNVFLFFDANISDRQHSEQGHGKRKVAQMKRQQFLSLDSQSIKLINICMIDTVYTLANFFQTLNGKKRTDIVHIFCESWGWNEVRNLESHHLGFRALKTKQGRRWGKTTKKGLESWFAEVTKKKGLPKWME